ncbi:MAG: HYR domain-containing protein [Gemmatimonadaceae bacterium]
MRRSTPFSALFSLLRASLASAFVLVAIVSCSSDNLAPKTDYAVDPNSIHIISVPDSVKEAYYASLGASSTLLSNAMLSVPARISSNSLASGSCSSGGQGAAYTMGSTGFVRESDPMNVVPLPRDGDDGYVADLPIGFDFNFYGNTYNKLNIYLNGFVTFGAVIAKPYWTTDAIPSATDPNNMIALAWNDWNPGKVANSLRFETRGTAPNREFMLQFNNVPEAMGAGHLTSLLVLSEGTNVITIYTTQFNMTYAGHRMTQGIENADGSLALYGTALNPAGMVTDRVRGFFSLANDTIRFSPVRTRDDVPPTITAPANLTANNDPHLASAVVTVVAPAASDDCSPVTLSSVRSDGAAIDAPYPVGVTTITWTAKDDAGNTSSATETVTVLDVEAPVFGLSAQSLLEFNATSPSGANVSFNTSVTDNVGVTALSCEPASGSLFPVGHTTVTCTASDAAGNSSSESFLVSVIGAHEQLFNLLQYVISLNLPNGTSQPLVNQLRAAYSQDAYGACNKLGDFVSMVQKKSGNIPNDQKAIMISEASRVMNATGCTSGISTTISTRSLPHF